MSFSSIEFILFFATVLAVTAALERANRIRAKEIFLLISSYFFYGYWDWRFCFLLLFVTVVSYLAAVFSEKRVLFILGVTMPLVVLGVFKYLNFAVSIFSQVFSARIDIINIILPVGISFYTFQALSYVIDVQRGKIPVERDFIKLALYLSFFPQLVAGPIVRAVDFLPQLRENRRITADGLCRGVQLILFGLVKKLLLADHLAVFVDDVFSAPAAFHWATILLSVVSYAIQIYLDFSGYSDIATGCASCMGYDFAPNFNLPYLSASITEFWRRWHISLSTCLKEYLYIPLGGNRKGTRRWYVNLLLTMLLGGLWHGADWTFVFWGGLQGVALCVDKILPKKEKGLIGQIIGIICTTSFVCFSWIFFRADSFQNAWDVIRGIFTLQQGVVQPYTWSFIAMLTLLIATIAAITKTGRTDLRSTNGFYPCVDLKTIPGLIVFFTACGLLLGLAYTGEQPFVYFQF